MLGGDEIFLLCDKVQKGENFVDTVTVHHGGSGLKSEAEEISILTQGTWELKLES